MPVRAGLRCSCWRSQHLPVSRLRGREQIPAAGARRSERSRFPQLGRPEGAGGFHSRRAWLHSFGYEEAIDAFRAAQTDRSAVRHGLLGRGDVLQSAALVRRRTRQGARGAWPSLGRRRRRARPRRRRHANRCIWPRSRRCTAREHKPARDKAYCRVRWRRWPRSFRKTTRRRLSMRCRCWRRCRAVIRRCRCASRRARSPKASLKRNPQHPGALHYILHAYDHPQLAARALPAARAYAKIAPAASHALHMPAHTFVQLGLWDEAAATDQASWDASIAWAKRRGLSVAHARLSQPVVASVRMDAARAVRQVDRRAEAGHREAMKVVGGGGGVGGHHYADSEIGRGSGPMALAQRQRVDARSLRHRKRALERDEELQSRSTTSTSCLRWA